jgi:mRNA interferase RelE/StbE
MTVEFKKSFLKDLNKLKDRRLEDAIHASIVDVENTKSLSQIKNLKKLSGYEHHYRIRLGDYRIGLKVENESVFFVVFEHRKDIYKKFP